MRINRKVFFDVVRKRPFDGITEGQVKGTEFLIDVWEEKFSQRTPLTQFANILGTAYWETATTMQPIREIGTRNYFMEMYDPTGKRPHVAKRLGNTNVGDGAKFPGMGFVQSTGRGNARKATKRLRELGIIGSDVDFEETPEKLMEPKIAAAVLFIGMEEGWFTGITLDERIDPHVDGDERQDFVRARGIVNGEDKAVEIAEISSQFLVALIAAAKSSETEPTPAKPVPPVEPPIQPQKPVSDEISDDKLLEEVVTLLRRIANAIESANAPRSPG